jgi:hypothetical protein
MVMGNNNFGGLKVLTIADNGLNYTITNTEISEGIINELEIIKERIKSGKIIVRK